MENFIYPVLIIFLALVFDFYNGMNDSANSIATVVSTRVLRPFQAVALAAFFNFAAAFLFETTVAKTIGKGIIDTGIIDYNIIFAALLGAILLTSAATHLGLPISVSHSIIGGLGGAALMKSGFGGLNLNKIGIVLLFIFLAPILGFIISYIFSIVTLWIVRNFAPRKVDKWFRKLQLVSASVFSLSHGANDAQKTMGIIGMVLAVWSSQSAVGFSADNFEVPFWVVLVSHTVIGLGTLIGGWKVIKTLGMRMTKLTPFGGFSAETASGLTIIIATILGIPVSTTHTITGSITGVGAIKGFSAVRWGVARNILWAWVLTIPLSGLAAAITYLAVTGIISLF